MDEGRGVTVNATCPYCGEEARLEVHEVYVDERTVVLDACCEDAHTNALDELLGDPKAFGRFVSEETGLACRAVLSDTEVAPGRYGSGGLVLDMGLQLHDITWQQASAWVQLHHRHNASPTGWRWGHAVSNGGEMVGVATVGRPVARMLNGTTTVEVTRLCVDPGLPPALARNACSMLYGAAAREAKRRGYERAITYTREGEFATSIEAAGWCPTRVTKLDRRGWSRGSRPRVPEQRCRKLRWERGLTRSSAADVAARRLSPALVADLAGRHWGAP